MPRRPRPATDDAPPPKPGAKPDAAPKPRTKSSAPPKPPGKRSAAVKRTSAPLKKYGEKRDFQRTPEPGPAVPEGGGGPLTFVVQKHSARRLHYDLRLELGGVMLSWAVPRGPSTDPAERRLAAHVEDHPLDYARFEGVIPAGEYGAGQVIVWDRGTYSPDEEGALSFHDLAEAEERMRAALADGKISVRMRGHRMKGSWALVRTDPRPGDAASGRRRRGRASAEAAREADDVGERSTGESWLLLKHRDEAATPDVDPERDLTSGLDSVLSDLTIERLKAGHRAPEAGAAPPLRPAELEGARPLPASRRRERTPMLATLAEQPFSRAGWIFEPKLDGVRALARIERRADGANVVTLTSRRGVDLTRSYPLLVRELAAQPLAGALLDGEIVALDEVGRPSFERLQQRMNLQDDEEVARAAAETPALLYAFDLVELEGYDLARVPLTERQRLLSLVLSPTGRLRLVERVEEDGEAAYAAATALGFEGIVAKRADSPYEPGRRSARWLKVKARHSDEFVVAGYVPGNGSRAHTFGALVLAEHRPTADGSAPVLSYVARVGSGFRDAQLSELRARLDGMRIDESPLAEVPAEAREATWVRPELVCEVKFAERTSSGGVRAPVFLRLRDDRDPSEIVRSTPAAVTAAASPAARVRGEARRAPLSPGGTIEEEAARVIAQLEAAPRASLRLAVEGEEVRLTNLDKPLWPPHAGAPAVTKRGLLLYLARVAPPLLRHVRDRPLTLTRYPNGIEGGSFYQKHWEQGRPDSVATVEVWSETADGDRLHLLCNNLSTLMWLGQLADLELHVSLARVTPEPGAPTLGREFGGSREQVLGSLLNHPDYLLFDLDPYIYSGREQAGEEPELNRRAWERTVALALELRELLDAAGLPSFVKSSGATGLHVHVPIVREPAFGYEAVRGICLTFAEFLARAHPKDVTLQWKTEDRRGRVFLDVNQNARIKNMAAPYSPRAKPGAPVSTPLRWEELGRVYPTDFTVETVPARLATIGDPWAEILEARQRLSTLGLTAGD